MKIETFVEFLYPGILVSESSTKLIKSREQQIKIPAHTFGYRIYDVEVWETTREDGKKSTERSEQKNTSPWIYFGEEWTLDHVRRLEKSDSKRWHNLRVNMESNHYDRVVRTKFGQCIPLDPKDVVQNPPKT